MGTQQVLHENEIKNNNRHSKNINVHLLGHYYAFCKARWPIMLYNAPYNYTLKKIKKKKLHIFLHLGYKAQRQGALNIKDLPNYYFVRKRLSQEITRWIIYKTKKTLIPARKTREPSQKK